MQDDFLIIIHFYSSRRGVSLSLAPLNDQYLQIKWTNKIVKITRARGVYKYAYVCVNGYPRGKIKYYYEILTERKQYQNQWIYKITFLYNKISERMKKKNDEKHGECLLESESDMWMTVY